jgi:iron-sulfur cluster assembly protein
MNITLTENAAKQITSQLAKRGKGLGLRVGVKKVGCSGFGYTFDYADDIRPDDRVIEAHGAKLVVGEESAAFLDGARLDFVRDGFKQVFRFDNPNVEASCGCGESFSFKSREEGLAEADAQGER